MARPDRPRQAALLDIDRCVNAFAAQYGLDEHESALVRYRLCGLSNARASSRLPDATPADVTRMWRGIHGKMGIPVDDEGIGLFAVLTGQDHA